jgi:hypothetical protein
MIIHVTGSIKDKNKDTSALRSIIEAVHDTGATISTDWIESISEEHSDVTQWQSNIDDDIDAIKRSDIAIIEATHYDFNQGFQVGAALHYKKPILLISRVPIDGKIVSWITDDLLTSKVYDDSDQLVKIVRDFITQNTISTKDLRFNFFMDRHIHSYLEEVSQETGRNKSEIIRDVIARGIREDKD